MSASKTPIPLLQQRLDNHCSGCVVGNCGGRHTRFACGDPGLYPTRLLHPASAARSLLESLNTLPEPPTRWAQVDDRPATLPVLEAPDWSGGEYLLDISTTLARRGRQLPLINGRAALLVGRDRDEHRVWADQGRLLRWLPRHFSFVIPPGFSQYDGCHPPAHSRLVLLQTLRLMVELAVVCATVFHLTWRFEEDLALQAGWLAWTVPPAIFVDLGLAKGTRFMERLGQLRMFAQMLPGNAPLLLAQGVSSRARVRALTGAWPGRVRIVSQRPWILARNGKLLDFDLVEHRSELRADELVSPNLRNFEAAMKRAQAASTC